MNNWSKCLFLGITFIGISCRNNKFPDAKYYENGSLKELTIAEKESSKSKAVYSFDENGSIKKISRYNEQMQLSGEQILFFKSGRLDRKLSYVNGSANGNTYYFFESNGALKNFRFFKNDRESLYGSDFWGDSIDIMKAWLYFNDSGQVIYKKNFDKDGRLVSEEGARR